MFGYILPDKGELKIKEYEVYSGYYCGICKSLGNRLGQIPRTMLNYDFVFLAVLLASLEEGKEAMETEHCVLHHIKKRAVVHDEWAIDYAGDVTLMMAYYKLLDDVNDEGSNKAKFLSRLLERTMERVDRNIGGLCELTGEKLEELSLLEKGKSEELDRVMEPFGEVMREAFSRGIEYRTKYFKETGDVEDLREKEEMEKGSHLEKQSMVLGHIGYHLGKWVYLMDAYEDVEENLEKGTYNPLIYRFEYSKDKESVCQFKDRIKDRVSFNLMHYLAEISKGIDLLDIKKNRGILDNIVYFGLRKRTEDVLNNQKRKGEKLHE